MNKKFLGYMASLILIVGCTKSKKENTEDTFLGSVDTFTNLNKYKINEKIINDSIVSIEGTNRNFTIQGNFNKRSNKKIDWWQVVDRKDSTNKLKIQYLLFEEKNIVNQIKSYKKGKIDTLNSKFYLVKSIDDSLKYSFYLPLRKNKIISSKFYYQIEAKEYIQVCNKRFNHYECFVKNPNDNKVILGVFSEAMENSKHENDIDISEIYIE
ncbi:hypothetical protein IQ37_05740 [Chryseobacterium piperi]|uniref:Lipoprotein n=1 Tax=Chryseobacterium piperi TaxID=558152 RepID=A0A086BKQ3_9FLAO|nr:hypothetical protein [Chryseobacterium piperi]ASW72866.1 hypothetical protein CJF12_00200 [Chryseobacterium piperi]KFF29517.1 hypothetical protein IQ37_05740 [Chryseobacterium piperi]